MKLARLSAFVLVTTLFAASTSPVAASANRYVQISTGEDHTCALTSNGRAFCWGSNFDGELGDGTRSDSGVHGPQAVIGRLRFSRIDAGGSHTCALTKRGIAYCWGSNFYGELGDGTTSDSAVAGPRRVIGGLRFASIEAGGWHTCALTIDGRAYCWGENLHGQLGDGTTDLSGVTGPREVIGGHRFKSISAAAYDHTCALEVGGAAYCWGYNNAGQLGDGTTADSGVGGPKAVIGGLLFTSISAGYDKTCGLVMGGKAYCWGDNGFGELGDGTILPSDTLGPREVIGGYLFNSIQSGGYHTCGISTLGRTLCWGDNTYGELGDGTLNPSAANGPQVVIGGLRFTSLGGNGYNTCALTRRGDAYCWGYNEFGDLGDGTRVTSGVSGPQPVL